MNIKKITFIICVLLTITTLSGQEQHNIKNDTQTILIIGGAGYIGSHTAYLMAQQGNNIIVLDNLWYGHTFKHPWAEFIQGDYGDSTLLETIFSQHKIDAVIHFASFTKVEESSKNPANYYDNNTIKTATLLNTMVKHQIKKIVFSSSALVYGTPQTALIDETHQRKPTSPYGNTKLTIELLLEDYAKAYDLSYVALRYFNVAGALPEENLGDWYENSWHLVPLLLHAVIHNEPFVVFTGHQTPDGTNIRDYVHVLDVAQANAQALNYLNAGNASDTFNIATSKGASVQELVAVVEKVTHKKITVTYQNHKTDFPDITRGNATKAQSLLNWQPIHSDLENIVASAYQFELQKNQKKLPSGCGF